MLCTAKSGLKELSQEATALELSTQELGRAGPYLQF